MKRWLSIALLFIASLGFAADEGQYFDIKGFGCGVDSYHSSIAIDDCYVQDALNVYFDEDAPVVKRGGYTTFASSSAYTFTGLWSYTDTSNNVWMVGRTSDTIIATTGVGITTFNIKIATVTVTNVVNAVNGFGNIYFTDQTQGVYYWNGTSTTYVSGSPRGSLIAQFHGRVWVSGLASPLGNYLYGSKYLDGQTWATGVNANDPVLFQIALNDNFDTISALWAGFNDILYIFKNYSIHAVYGFDQNDFVTRAINGEVGCIDQRSIQFYLGGLVFASARGIEAFDGYTASRISDPIKDRVDPVTVNSTFSQNSWTQQNATDWVAGSFNTTTSLNSVVSSPYLVLSTFSQTSDTAAEWNAGTLNALTVSGNNLTLSVANGNIDNYSFENGNIDNWTVDTTYGDDSADMVGENCTTNPRTGSKLFEMTTASDASWNAIVKLQTCAGTDLTSITVPYAANSCTWTSRTLSSSGQTGKSVKIVIQNDGGGITNTAATSDCFLNSGTDVTFYTASDIVRSAVPSLRSLSIDDVTSGRNQISSGTFTSPTFNTDITPITIYTSATWNASTLVPSIVTQHSTNGTSWVDLTASTGTNVTSTRKYLRFISTFTWTTAVDANTTLSSVGHLVSASSGVWTSQIHNISTATAFGNFVAATDLTSGGTIDFAVCTGNNPLGTGKVCVNQTPNASISAALNIFTTVIATFSVTSATNTPKLQLMTVQWFTGSRKPPMASAVYDNRYWLSVTTDTANSNNDTILVLSKGPLWTYFDIHAGALLLWKNSLYFGNSFASGYVYQLEQGQNDNGAAINAFIHTKDFAPGGLTTDKFFNHLYLVADNLGDYRIYTDYFIDRSTNTFTLGNMDQDETPGTLISRLNIPIDATHMNFGKIISFKFKQYDLSAPWKFYGASLKYKARRPL